MNEFVSNLQKGLTIGIGIAISLGFGAITYGALSSLTAVDTETLTASKWNSLVEHAVPSGSVIAFNLSTCPTGWSTADGTSGTPDLRGTFIRGMNGSVNGRDVSRTLGEYQADEFKSHRHSFPRIGDFSGSNNGFYFNNAGSAGAYVANANGLDFAGGTETRPKNVTLLYCVKN